MRQGFLLTGFVLAGAALIAGCTTTDTGIGANSRAGYVHAFYSVEKLRTDPPTCLRALTPEQIATGRYVEIKVSHGRRSEYLAAIAPPEMQVQLHDEVEFSPKHCEQGVIPEIKQILKRS